MFLLKESLNLAKDKRSDLWYDEATKLDIPLEMNNGYVNANCSIFYDGDFEEMLRENNINWYYYEGNEEITMVEEGLEYIASVVNIPNRFDNNLCDESIVIIDTLKLK